ncbi:hypothetical protein M758_8G069400 [Ceratodon purpureus]|nr:hypothetical protein M758_8G069400 [Ceratodon purpureus]
METKIQDFWKAKVLLFGRTGSGKSTVANMLINGHLRPPFLFPTSSGVRGKTLSFQREESEDFVVVDTVGFGEGEYGSVADAEARNRLYDFFVKITEESYNYYAYVHKWGKLDQLDVNLWNFFRQAFAGAETNFVIIFTHCSPKFLEQNLKDIKMTFQGCERYIPVDFPASDKPEFLASAMARRKEALRLASLKRLYECLERFMGLAYVPFLCLRSNLKKGRILLLGTATSARNMVAKLLVDGTINTTSTVGVEASTMDGTEINGNEKAQCTDFAELEGRRWQVVNVFAFDKESVGAIYGVVDGLFKKNAVSAKSTAAAAMIASKFMTIMQHGDYSHFLYVEEWGNKSVASRSVLKEITNALGVRLKSSILVIVNSDHGKVQPKVPKRFKDWGATLQIQLPSVHDLPDMEREKDSVLRHSLGILEEALHVSNSIPFMRNIYDTIDINAFEGLVLAHQELQPKTSINNLFDFNPLQKLKSTRLGAEKVESAQVRLISTPTVFSYVIQSDEISDPGAGPRVYPSYVSTRVLRLPVKHRAAQIPCRYKEKMHQYLCIIIGGKNKITQSTVNLGDDFIWGELQVVDKHHLDKKLIRLPLFPENCAHKLTSLDRDVWYVGDHYGEKEFIESLSNEDSIILWMYPYPYEDELHKDVLEIILRFSDHSSRCTRLR